MPIFNTNVFRAGGRKENDSKKKESKDKITNEPDSYTHKSQKKKIRKNSCEKT